MTTVILKFLVNTCILFFCWWWSSQCLEFHSLLLNVDNLERERERGTDKPFQMWDFQLFTSYSNMTLSFVRTLFEWAHMIHSIIWFYWLSFVSIGRTIPLRGKKNCQVPLPLQRVELDRKATPWAGIECVDQFELLFVV